MLDLLNGKKSEPIDWSKTGPGPKELLYGNYYSGYFGKLSPSEFPVTQKIFDLLKEDDIEHKLVTLSARHNTIEWHKFIYNGRILYYPRYGFIKNVTPHHLYRKGMLHGDYRYSIDQKGAMVYSSSHNDLVNFNGISANLGRLVEQSRQIEVIDTETQNKHKLLIRTPRKADFPNKVQTHNAYPSTMFYNETKDNEYAGTFARLIATSTGSKHYPPFNSNTSWAVNTLGHLNDDGTVTGRYAVTGNTTNVGYIYNSRYNTSAYWIGIDIQRPTMGYMYADLMYTNYSGYASNRVVYNTIITDVYLPVLELDDYHATGLDLIFHSSDKPFVVDEVTRGNTDNQGEKSIQFYQEGYLASKVTLPEVTKGHSDGTGEKAIEFYQEGYKNTITPLPETTTSKDDTLSPKGIEYYTEFYKNTICPVDEISKCISVDTFDLGLNVEFTNDLLVGEALWQVTDEEEGLTYTDNPVEDPDDNKVENLKVNSTNAIAPDITDSYYRILAAKAFVLYKDE